MLIDDAITLQSFAQKRNNIVLKNILTYYIKRGNTDVTTMIRQYQIFQWYTLNFYHAQVSYNIFGSHCHYIYA